MPDLVSRPKSEKGAEKAQQPSLNVPIGELGLRARGRSVLLGVGMKTVGDVLAALEKKDQVLTDPQAFSPDLMIDLKRQLRRRGYTVPGEPAPAAGAPAGKKKSLLARLKGLRGSKGSRRVQKPKAATEEKPRRRSLLRRKEQQRPSRIELARSRLEAAAKRTEEIKPVEAVAKPVEAVAKPAETVAKPVETAKPPKKSKKPRKKIAPRINTEWAKKTYARAAKGFRAGGWFYGVIGAFAIVGLLLPPFSLGTRLSEISSKPLRADRPALSHEDGLTLSVDSDFTGDLRVDLDSLSQEDFLQEAGGEEMARARAALPDYMTVHSPVYLLDVTGEPAEPVTVEVVMPAGAEPWETLDLYTWTGEAWEFVPSELAGEFNAEYFKASLADLPSSLVVAQTSSMTPTVASLLEADDLAAAAAANLVDQLNPVGLTLGTLGGFTGDVAALPTPGGEGSWAILPSLRNWSPAGVINSGLVAETLSIAVDRQAHIDSILQLCSDNGFAGIELDYRGLPAEEAEAYAAFIESLSTALHSQGLILSVVLDPPVSTETGWDSGGYDWPKIGAHADIVKVRFSDNPEFYLDDNGVEDLMDWATGHVHRHKLLMLVSSLSLELTQDSIASLSLEEALAPFGEVGSVDEMDSCDPGEDVHLTLTGSVTNVSTHETLGTYSYEYETADGETRTVWLGTGEALAAKLDWGNRYHLGGVALSDLLTPGNAESVAATLSDCRQQALAASVTFPPERINIDWATESETELVDQQSALLTEPEYSWTAADDAGIYTVTAAIAGFDHGQLALTVGTIWTAEDADCLDATFVTDVTVPDGTGFDPGEAFEKTWRIENSGECDWPNDTVLVFDSGSQMGGPDSVPVGEVAVGDTVDIGVELTAPETDGSYTGVWRLAIGEIDIPGGGMSVVIQSGEVAALPPAAAASGGPFELGGHVKDYSHPYSDAMHYSGMNWSKVQVRWRGGAREVIEAAHAKGFKIQISALGGPGMVTQSNFEQDVAAWVAEMAAAGADAIEIWNEPNIEREWAAGHIDPGAYTRLLCACYSAIKAANPSTMVISAAPAPTGWFGGACGPAGCDDLPWIQGMYNSGAAQCMDYIGAHHNAGATSPSARTGHPADPGQGHHSWYFLPQTEAYFYAFGGARKLFYTEMGYASQEGLSGFSDAFWWARNTNNAQQAAWLAEAVGLSINTGMVRVIIVWNIDFTRAGADPQDGYAIIRPGGACPACESLHALLGSR